MHAHEEWYPGHLRELSEQECRELLGDQRVGRVAWSDADGPVVLTVNYRSELARHFSPGRAAFQIDYADEFLQSGWSVLVRGRAELLEWDELPPDEDRPTPWAEGTRNVYVRITPDRITGRRVLPA